VEIVDGQAIKFSIASDKVSFIKNYVEKSQVLADDGKNAEMLVYWGIEEMQRVAKVCGDKVPSPIQKDYKWPGMYTPFKHQETTAAFLSLQDRAFCFNEAGTGKTSSVIWAADYLMTQGLIKRVLIICPLSIMYSAWQADIFKTAMHRSVAVAYGDANKRKKVINGIYEFVIINYDGVGIVAEDISKLGFDLIVIDEANAYKTATTKRFKTMAKILQPSTKLWMLTGTPASQSPLDAFGLAKLVNPGGVPRYFTAWRDKVMHQITRFKYVPKPTSRQDVYNALQPAIRFEKDQCLDLPDVTFVERDAPLTPQQMKYYKLLKKQMTMSADGEQVTSVNAATNINKLLQISGGAVYTDTREVIEFDVSNRLKVILEVIEEGQ
jgi:SNF2 family DNA or RNA helicase